MPVWNADSQAVPSVRFSGVSGLEQATIAGGSRYTRWLELGHFFISSFLVIWVIAMANLNKYDPRLESLVMETRTFWDPDLSDISPEDRRWLAAALHQNPQLASKIKYERSHTGFTREITVTIADIERLYEERASA